MKYAYVPLDALRPIQSEVSRDSVRYFEDQLERGVDLGPTPVVPLYDSMLNEQLIVADRHHRTYARCGQGELLIPVAIHEHDYEIRASQIGCLSILDTMDDVRDVYWPWLMRLERHGVTNIADMMAI
ncbi:MAG TPA: hypothetical protein VJP80_04545 [Candidatus Saccharimonadales bacterium]|nr:hypothetical protein [Candidatus Saccharimonadales bacterium]